MLRWLQGRKRRWRARRRGQDGWPVLATAERPRVLMEVPSFATPSVAANVLRRAGYEPLICEGPGDTAGVCRLLETGECSLARHADVVFNAFGLGAEEHRAIITALRRRYPNTPVVVEVTGPSAAAHADLLADCTVCTTPMRSRELIGAIASGLATAGPPSQEGDR